MYYILHLINMFVDISLIYPQLVAYYVILIEYKNSMYLRKVVNRYNLCNYLFSQE